MLLIVNIFLRIIRCFQNMQFYIFFFRNIDVIKKLIHFNGHRTLFNFHVIMISIICQPMALAIFELKKVYLPIKKYN